MSHDQKSVNENDINVLEQMDDIIEDIHLETQKSLALSRLNPSQSETFFSEVFRLMNTLESLANEVENESAKLVAQGKIQVTKFDLEAKLNMQIKK
ncbi:hypothetical protein ACW5UC_24630 [Priestia aryabhattai]|uniref:hypothetical protein n=1 Tax=Priestia megaterium TaxID=1404 RepID=UPI003F9A825C